MALIEDVQYTSASTFPAKAENIALAEKLIDEACQKHGVHESHYGDISLIAITEAVNNAIHHGKPPGPAKNVMLGYRLNGDKIVFVVGDDGPRFRFRSFVGPHRSAESGEAARARGLPHAHAGR